MTLIAQHACCSLLGVDPKTLRRWLALAQISWLPHPTDARRRCLTPAHLQYLAAIHHRQLTVPLAEDMQPPDPSPADDTSTTPIDDASSSSLSELRKQVSQLQTTLTMLQQQLTQLTLDLLGERTQRGECASPIPHASLASPPPTQEKIESSSSPKPSPHPRKGRPRELVPLIEYVATGSYVIISPQHGQLHLKPESREWFAWLETLTSFRFVGKQGRLSTTRKTGRSSWMAYRRINGRCSTFSLGPTEQITLARLEHMASIFQAGASPKP